MIRLAAGKLKPEHPQLSKKIHGNRKIAGFSFQSAWDSRAACYRWLRHPGIIKQLLCAANQQISGRSAQIKTVDYSEAICYLASVVLLKT